MNYKIVDVEGIGNVYAEKLIAAGIESTDALLEKCAKPAGRKELADATGISPKLILTWANHTDLMRTRGQSNGIDLDRLNWGNYDLVVIDESHNFRNGTGIHKGKGDNRYVTLMKKVVKAGVKTKVLMLSATPVNNRFVDLRNQLALYIFCNMRSDTVPDICLVIDDLDRVRIQKKSSDQRYSPSNNPQQRGDQPAPVSSEYKKDQDPRYYKVYPHIKFLINPKKLTCPMLFIKPVA